MGNADRTSSGVQEIWTKLNARWKGEDATAFYREYILKITEIVDSFDDSCNHLSSLSSECMREIQAIELTLSNQ